MSAKEIIEKQANAVVGGMIKDNATVAFLLLIVAVLLGWYLYSNHALQQQLVDIYLLDHKREIERFKIIDGWNKKLSLIQSDIQEIRAAEVKFHEVLRQIKLTRCAEITK